MILWRNQKLIIIKIKLGRLMLSAHFFFVCWIPENLKGLKIPPQKKIFFVWKRMGKEWTHNGSWRLSALQSLLSCYSLYGSTTFYHQNSLTPYWKQSPKVNQLNKVKKCPEMKSGLKICRSSMINIKTFFYHHRASNFINEI